MLVVILVAALIIGLNLLGILSDIICGRSRKERKGASPGARLVVNILGRACRELFPGRDRAEKGYFDSVYIGEAPEDKRRRTKEKYADAILCVLAATCVIYFGAAVFSEGNRGETEVIARPESGTEAEKLVAEYRGKSYELNLSVDSIVPSVSRQEEYLDSVLQVLEETILGENEDLSHVKHNLDFGKRYYDDNLEIYWSSSDTGVISSDGKVFSEAVCEETDVTLTAHLKYFDSTRDTSFTVTVCPPDEESRIRQALTRQIRDTLAEEKDEEVVTLPDDFEGEEVKYRLYREDNSGYILLFGLIIASLIIPLALQKKKEKLRERNVSLICDYPDVVSKMTMLLESGASIRNAFERIAKDYEGRKTSGRYKKKKYVYEEMILTKNELALGVSEAEAYEAFGRRCGNIYYIRFASLLVQNIKKGNESLLVSLYQEVTEARRERQAEIRKKGEATGLKLLLPMMGMLAIVMAVIMIPAFLSM